MSQSPQASSSDSTRDRTVIISGLVCTFAIFLTVVLVQKISGFGSRKLLDIKTADAIPPPPPPPVEPPPPPDLKQPEQKPELKQEPPKLNLTQLEAAINPGMGTAVGDFGLDLQAFAAEDLDRIFDLAEVDRIPQAVYQSSPQYPYDMLRQGVQGEVRIGFVCTKDGRTQDVRVISSTRFEFERPALDAVRQWRFEPGVKNGQRVAVRMEVPIPFRVGR